MIKRETKREAVRRAAARVFLEKGFREATIQDIADVLGIPKGSAYYHMGSKEELLYDILMTGLQEGLERQKQIHGYPLPSLDRLRLAIRESIRSALEEVHAPVALHLTNGVRFLSPEHRTAYVALRDEYQALYVNLVQQGIEAGEIRPLTSPKIAVFGILSMQQNFLSWFRRDGPLDKFEVADIFWDMVVHGLKA